MRKTASLDTQAVVMRYMPYLSEIRKRLFFIFAVFFIAWVIGFIYYQPLVQFVMKLYDLKGVNVTFTSPFQFIGLAINSGMAIGIITVFPLLLFQVLSFLKPALRQKEYRLVLSLLPIHIFLFIGGFGFGIWLMKFVVSIYSQQSAQLNIQNLWDIDSFLSQIILTALLLGILFQLPIVLTLLMRLNVIKHSTIVKQRIPIYILLLIIVILLPPTDVFSMVMMFIPLALIFELTVLLNRNQSKPDEVKVY